MGTHPSDIKAVSPVSSELGGEPHRALSWTHKGFNNAVLRAVQSAHELIHNVSQYCITPRHIGVYKEVASTGPSW